jgi:hypothetical protein
MQVPAHSFCSDDMSCPSRSNFPQNRSLRDLPTIQGAILLLDADDGTPLAFLDSMEITLKRTGAATAVAGRYLARPDSRTATICGCGEQGRMPLQGKHNAPGRVVEAPGGTVCGTLEWSTLPLRVLDAGVVTAGLAQSDRRNTAQIEAIRMKSFPVE